MHRSFSWFLGILSLEGMLCAQDSNVGSFFDEFVPEQQTVVNTTFSPSAISPVAMTGYLPVVISNTTGLSDSQVYVILAGQQTAGATPAYFFQLGSGGVMTPVPASSSTFSVNYSYQLSSLPSCTTGAHNYLVYVPALNGARFYFSINQPMYLQSDTLVGSPPNQIVAPTYFAFYDPNFNTLYETVEATFVPNFSGALPPPAIPWSASINTTEVDAFCLPIKISYYSYSPSNPSAVTPLAQDPNALPSGFGVGGPTSYTTRSQILTSVVNGLTNGDLTTHAVWPRLAIPFLPNPYAKQTSNNQPITYLRILSPKQSMGNSATTTTYGYTVQHLPTIAGSGGTPKFYNYNYPPFPNDYLTNTTYGAGTNSFMSNLFNYYLTPTPNLYMSSGGGTPTVYKGVTTGSIGSQILTMTGVSGPNNGKTCVFDQSSSSFTSAFTYNMFSGGLSSTFVTGNSPDISVMGFYFGDAFIAGLIPSSIGTQNTATPPNIPINITDAVAWEPTFVPDYFVPENTNVNGGPWMDLYASLFHSVAVRNSAGTFLNGVGLCYAYDFDDSLGISGTITPANTTSSALNPYVGITLGAVDTNIPDPYSDTKVYNVTFTYPAGVQYALQYQQGASGQWISVTSGDTVAGIVSNSSNPLSIKYTNAVGTHQFVVYLYYQFLQPVNSYNSSEVNIINSSTITPNSSTVTSGTTYTINLLP